MAIIISVFFFVADFLVYLLVALQVRYFTRNPIRQGTPEQTNGVIVNLYKFQYWVDYCKVHTVHTNIDSSQLLGLARHVNRVFTTQVTT